MTYFAEAPGGLFLSERLWRRGGLRWGVEGSSGGWGVEQEERGEVVVGFKIN